MTDARDRGRRGPRRGDSGPGSSLVALLPALLVLTATGTAAAADPAATPATDAPVTDDVLEGLLRASPSAWALFLALKYVPPLIGLGLLIAAIVKRSVTPKEQRRPTGPPPVSLFRHLPPQLDVVGAIGVVLASIVLTTIAFYACNERWPGSLDTVGVTMLCTAMGSAPVAAWIVLRRAEAHRASPRPAGGPSRIGGAAWTYCVASAGVLAASFLVAIVYVLVLHKKPQPQDLVVKVISPDLALDPWLIFAFGVFVAPFTEEALFRGTLYPALRRWIGPIGAAVIVSALFASVHKDLAAALPLFVLALALTWIFERTDSLLAAVAVHALNNATSLIPLLMISRSP